MASKEELRRGHRRVRKAMSLPQLQEAGAGVAGHGADWAAGRAGGAPAVFAVYLGVSFEPPTLPLMAALHAAGHRVLLPVCEPERQLSWVHWTPDTQFVRSRYAPIDEPVGERHPSTVVAGAAGIFLPATAVDRAGSRIGQGGGYYDRLLDFLEGSGVLPPTIAVVYDGEVLPAGTIPAEPFDRPVAEALTPSGVVRLGTGPTADPDRARRSTVACDNRHIP
ncbi:5-formyltetrahydrofolate cyclo-ligase [Arthrobacter sp. CJ23]|uniref:5-formyltetrahydrofolate cyclo-ligase n=1 Tax=Arthrobacter sp. CJ23 TaxID=2972479 RepID=UPI00215BF96C|nr:5-formyltetrahydrofolate cyclo-ligase [Arthrobacter sp. CJ23]UVJ38477.1 5-formyltetrahydrofolate cyclo-ligase [Arthrobacter sp. CJ23]